MSGMGEVEVSLDGKKETLRCTVRAALSVNAMGGFGEVYRRLAAMDLEAYIAVVAAGLGKRPADVEERVYATGMVTLAEPLAEYVSRLANGGRPASRSEDNSSGEG